MSNLSAFLKPAYLREEKEIVISKRFLDEQGKPVPFKIRSISQEENEQITKASRRQYKVSGTVQERLDPIEYGRRMVVTGTVFPTFAIRSFARLTARSTRCRFRERCCRRASLQHSWRLSPRSRALTPTLRRTRQKTPRGGRPETMVAYYCFVNLGWPPSKYAALPYRERLLIAEFVDREIKSRKKAQK